ncbi:16S rRNA (guanine966-N2)-methyltransferase [Lachnospiraceae bacterium XBB2008]|nr:16S rRNA (guanine966-N2)-methyltransferase [Lachnospiraceae bacterium XBB2008]
MMRVIAGTARSMPLSTPKGNDTRPTTDRIKETLFNMLQSYIPDCVFVDVCSGSGAIGIEALSRGASHAYFIDRDQACIQCIKNNLSFTKLDQRSTIFKQDACTALNMIHEKAVDVVFADPPYEAGMERSLLGVLSKMSYVNEDTIIIIEALIDTDFSFASEYGFDILKEKCYKTNKHVWLTRQA